MEAKITSYLTLVERTIICGQIALQVPTLAMMYWRFRNGAGAPSFQRDTRTVPQGHEKAQGKEGVARFERPREYKRYRDVPVPKPRRGICYLIGIVISGLIAPPDIVSQVIIATPIMVIYEIAIYVTCIKFFLARHDMERNGTERHGT